MIELDKTGADEHTYEETSEFLKKEIDTVEALDQKWLIDTTEKFCKDRALFLALERSVILAEDKKSKQEPAAIIDILTKAIGVSFDSKVGHDHFDDAGERYDLYTQKVNKVPFDLDILNTITDGGAEEKTLNLVLGGCVHPDTYIERARAWSYNFDPEDGISFDTTVGWIVKNFRSFERIEVQSPDGWVPVSDVVAKGDFKEYVLTTVENHEVRSNADHRYETQFGWMHAKDMVGRDDLTVLTDSGDFVPCQVKTTGNIIPIVDLVIGHKNHRYYTNGVSSHNTNTGKTAVLCHLAAGYLKAGRDVLYITCEMADKKISQRIDANLFDLPLKQMKNLSKEDYLKRLDIIKKKGAGRLQVKEYPTATANANHFRTLLNELKTKKSFVPKVIIVDYLGICTSSRIKEGNSYTIFKSVAEELRGLFVEHEVVGWSAAQTNRNGVKNNDPDLGEVSESYGLSSTADFMLVLITDEELEANGQIIGKQLKNRYNDKASNRRFLLGFDRQRMKLYDVEATQPTSTKPTSPVSTSSPVPTKSEKFSGFTFDESDEE